MGYLKRREVFIYSIGIDVGYSAVKVSLIDFSNDKRNIVYSKYTIYISIKDGRVVDFMMNKICAAGTGSFLEEQAKKLEIEIEEFGEMALKSKKPVYLGDRCTVFIEASVADKLSKGVKHEDIAVGLCRSIVKNYFNKVVGNKKVGKRILLQGGIAHNQGVINAFRANLKEISDGITLNVPEFFSVTGAIGAGLFAK